MDAPTSRRDDSKRSRAADQAVEEPRGRRFRVVLEGVKAAYETPEAFAIKFGIALNQPVTKVKHYLRSVPTVIWEGESSKMAAGLLRMIDEAGGEGRIDEITRGAARAPEDPYPKRERPEAETDQPPQPAAGESPVEEPSAADGNEQGVSCPKCGFPARDGDKYCQFCMSPLEQRRRSRKVPQDVPAPKARIAVSIPPKRLLLYVSIVLLALIVQLALTL